MRAFSLFSVLLCAVCLPPAGAETAAPTAQALLGVKALEPFDGSTLMRVVFQDRGRTFRYSPPGGWEIRPGERTELTAGRFTATIVLTVRNEPLPVEREKRDAAAPKNSLDETTAKDLLPLKIAGQPAKRSIVGFAREGGHYFHSLVKSMGDDWRVELSLEGPAEEFAGIEKLLLESLCSIGIQTNHDLQRIAKEKERQALTEIVQAAKAAAKPIPSGRLRGKL